MPYVLLSASRPILIVVRRTPSRMATPWKDFASRSKECMPPFAVLQMPSGQRSTGFQTIVQIVWAQSKSYAMSSTKVLPLPRTTCKRASDLRLMGLPLSDVSSRLLNQVREEATVLANKPWRVRFFHSKANAEAINSMNEKIGHACQNFQVDTPTARLSPRCKY